MFLNLAFEKPNTHDLDKSLGFFLSLKNFNFLNFFFKLFNISYVPSLESSSITITSYFFFFKGFVYSSN